MDDAVLAAHSRGLDRISAPPPVDLNPADEQKRDHQERGASRPEDPSHVGQHEPETAHDCREQDDDQEPFAGVMQVRDRAGPERLLSRGGRGLIGLGGGVSGNLNRPVWPRASASRGETQIESVDSLPSWGPTCSGGAAARKNQVSNRFGTPSGVIQCA